MLLSWSVSVMRLRSRLEFHRLAGGFAIADGGRPEVRAGEHLYAPR
jgi:hypothetical protein